MGARIRISGHGAGLMALCAAALCLFPVSQAFAQVGYVLCWVFNYAVFGSNLGRGIATLGVFGLAIGAMFGKVSWHMAILVTVGISGLFGAAGLFVMMAGNSYGSC